MQPPANPDLPASRRPPAGPTPVVPPPSGNGGGRIDDPGHQLPPHRGKIARMQGYAEGAVLGLRDWIELRIELVRTEVEEFIEGKTEQAKYGALLAVFGALAGLFFLITLGYAFAALLRWIFGIGILSSLTGGFGLVFLLLALVALGVYRRSPFRQSS